MKLKRSFIGLICCLSVLLLFDLQILALTPGQVFEKAKESVVVVNTLDAQGNLKSQGSGVIISSDKVATNCHVVEGGDSYQVGWGKQFIPATLYGGDDDKDICILSAKVVSGKPVQIGKAGGLKVGDQVYAIGAPRGLELSLSDGIVAQLRGGPVPLIQTTAAISPGSSGGGLFDEEGKLVGLTTLYLEGGQSLNFAMPVEWIVDIEPGLKSTAEGRGQAEWLKKAIALEQSNNGLRLFVLSLEWVKADPKNSTAWFSLGNAYSMLANNDKAIEAYRQSLRIDSRNFNAWLNLGNSYFKLKRYDDAIDAYRKALLINPQYTLAWYNLGNVYSDLKRYGDAIEAYRQYLRINSQDASVWYNLGHVYSELKRYDDAIEAYRQSLQSNPQLALAWYSLGNAYIRIKRYDDAIEAFRQSLRINPQDALAWYNLGCVFDKLKHYDNAIEAYRQSLLINPQSVRAWTNIAIDYSLSGNIPAALEAVRELHRFDTVQADKLFDLIVPR